MAVENVLGHLPGHDIAVGIEQIGVACALLRGHLERHMQQLADMGIEVGMQRHVPNGGGESKLMCEADAMIWCWLSMWVAHSATSASVTLRPSGAHARRSRSTTS